MNQKTLSILVASIATIFILLAVSNYLPIPDGCQPAGDFLGTPTGGFDENGAPIGNWLTILPKGHVFVIQATARGGYHFDDGTYHKFAIAEGGTELQNTDGYVLEAGWQCSTDFTAYRRMRRLEMGLDYSPHGLAIPENLHPLHEWLTYNN